MNNKQKKSISLLLLLLSSTTLATSNKDTFLGITASALSIVTFIISCIILKKISKENLKWVKKNSIKQNI